MSVSSFWALARVLILGVLAMPSLALANSAEYGSFRFDDAIPRVLFLVGEIKSGDSFELRRSMRDHEIQLVVTASAGGNLYEGLQLASIVNDKGLATYVPSGGSCESSCANVFFGGVERLARGELGVHQFYSGAEDATAPGPKNVTAAQTQYTTADIIGIMNSLGTPPFVYEKMFSTKGIYYFSTEELDLLARGIDSIDLEALTAEVESFLAVNRDILRRPSSGEQAWKTGKSSVAAPLAPPLPPLAREVSRFEGKDFFGSDLSSKGVRGVSLAECERICLGDASCAAYSYVKKTRWCWPKSGIENMSIADGVVSAIVDVTRVDPDIFERSFTEGTAIDIPGYDILTEGVRNTSLEGCRQICEVNGGCLAFSWVAKKAWCFPKYAVGDMRTAIGIISGVRK